MHDRIELLRLSSYFLHRKHQPTSKTFTLKNEIIATNTSKPTTTAGEGLKREIGIAGVFLNVINNTLGSGIFLLPAIVASTLGNASILAYIVCGGLFLLLMLCYAEISSQVTISGGSYAYIETAFGPYAGFLSNTLFWFGVGVFVTAALVNGVADILSVAAPLFKIPVYRALLFALPIGFFAFINIRGVKQGMLIIKLLTILKLVPIFLLIIVGIFRADAANLHWENLPSIKSLGLISLVLFFAFAGGETALNVGGEIKNPNRTAPLGLLFGMMATIIIFCAIQLVAQGVLGADLVNHKEAPLAVVGEKLLGPWGYRLVIAGSLAAILGILSSLPLLFSRVMFAGATDRLLPAYLAKVHPRFSTPANAIITFSAVAFIVAVSGGFRQLAVIVSATLLIIYAGVVLATIKFRLTKQADKPGTFKIPGGLTIPIAALVAICLFFIQLDLKEILGVSIFMAVLSIIYLFKIIRTKRSAAIGIPGV
jgi:APA family basic amino acid/polyamine antiporter